MASRKQQLIAMFGLRIYRELMDVLKEMREVRKGKRELVSIEIEKGKPLSDEKRKEIAALFEKQRSRHALTELGDHVNRIRATAITVSGRPR